MDNNAWKRPAELDGRRMKGRGAEPLARRFSQHTFSRARVYLWYKTTGQRKKERKRTPKRGLRSPTVSLGRRFYVHTAPHPSQVMGEE
jgi:hypothetical protein